MPASEVELTPSPVHRRNPKSSSFSRNNNIESHQYEEYENEVWKHHQAQYKFSTQTHWWSTINKRQCRMWTQTLVIGILTGISAYFVIYCTGRLTAIKLSILYRYIDLERDGEIAFGNAFGIYALFNCLCVSIAWFTVYMAPNAAGSGIPEVKSFLNGLSVPFLGMNTILWKLFGIVFTVSGGLPAGKEGPMIHAGSGWALAVCESDSLLKRVGLNTSFRKFHDFHNDGEKRDYVTTGAAAGVAAAFGAPVGGVLFSLEEGASFFSKTLVWRSFFCAMVAVTTLFVIRTVNIHLGQAHANAMFSFGEFFRLNASVYNFSVWELPLFCLQGFMGGLIGAAFNEANKRLHKFRMSHYIGNMGVRWIEVLCVSLVMSIVSFGIPTLFPYCTPKPSNMEDWTDQEKDLSNRLVPLYCDPEKEYSQTGSLYLTDSDTAIKQLFHFREIGDDAEPTFSSGSLVLFFLPYICLACLNYGTAVPSGLFVPSLLQGACFGRLVGHLLHAFDRRRGTFADSGTFALVGAAAGLGGMARMTISLVVILLEATGDIQYLVPLMLTVMLARWVGNCFNDGLYDIHIHLKNIPLLEENDPDNAMVDISVADVMTSAPVCIPPLVSVCEVFALLQRNRHHCFPVIGKSHLHENSKRDDGGPDILLGVVPRKVREIIKSIFKIFTDARLVV